MDETRPPRSASRRPADARSPRPSHFLLVASALLALAACGSGLVQTVGPLQEARPAAAEVELGPLSKHDEAAGFTDDRVGPVPPAGDPSVGASDGALIVRWGSLELEVPDVTVALSEARREVAALGGYVAGWDESDQGERRWASVTFRVPVARFDAALEALRGTSERVVRESTQSQEVTTQVVDLDARITNLRASEQALVEIMARAGRIEDVLAVQMRLEDVRSQIERLVAQRGALADQAALATISTTWSTPVAAVQAAQEAWDLGTEIDAALAQTVAALQAAASVVVWLAVVGLPVLGIPVLLLGAVLLLLRRRFVGRGTGMPGGSPAAGGTPAE
jgi:hypothetical protein